MLEELQFEIVDIEYCTGLKNQRLNSRFCFVYIDSTGTWRDWKTKDCEGENEGELGRNPCLGDVRVGEG
ncbi:hypothetical protein NPIL_248621, partial [Nephila pilipes]